MRPVSHSQHRYYELHLISSTLRRVSTGNLKLDKVLMIPPHDSPDQSGNFWNSYKYGELIAIITSHMLASCKKC